MREITEACDALNRFKYASGPYGVTSPPPGSKGVALHEYIRIEPLSGIAGPGRWRIKRLSQGEPNQRRYLKQTPAAHGATGMASRERGWPPTATARRLHDLRSFQRSAHLSWHGELDRLELPQNTEKSAAVMFARTHSMTHTCLSGRHPTRHLHETQMEQPRRVR